jgi:hypothetical protein
MQILLESQIEIKAMQLVVVDSVGSNQTFLLNSAIKLSSCIVNSQELF